MKKSSTTEKSTWSRIAIAAAIATTLSTVSASQSSERDVLRVCADPNYAPFSTQSQQGFENKIAKMIADDLGVPLEFEWFPQRMGFIRNTLSSSNDDGQTYKCDLVMGVPEQYDRAITTEPYYRSTYSLVYVEGSDLDGIKSGNDLIKLDPETLNNLNIGMSERSPGTLWLAKHNLYDLIKGYVAQSGDPKEFPGQPILNDLQSGKIDAAVMWGPTAGLFSEHTANGKKIISVPFNSEPGIRFDYTISAAVRRGEKPWRDQVNTMLQAHLPDITQLLEQHHVPLLEISK